MCSSDLGTVHVALRIATCTAPKAYFFSLIKTQHFAFDSLYICLYDFRSHKSRDEHLSPGTQIPTSPSPFGGEFLGKIGEMGRDEDDFYPHIKMGMGIGGGVPSPFPQFPQTLYII